MIIVSDKNRVNTVYFPKNLYDNTGPYTVTLCDRGTNKKYYFAGLEDNRLASHMFYTFSINFSELPAGEYEYEINDEDESVCGTGIIRLNELVSDTVTYNKNNEYIAYEQ